MEFKITDFTSREDLEAMIKSQVGADIRLNNDAGHTISGKRNDFKKFGLDDTCAIYGCKIIITDLSLKDILAEKIKKQK